MNKAVLLSVFIFPGAGHLYLRKFKTGIVLLIISMSALSVMVYQMMQKSFEIIEKIQRGEIGSMDVMGIAEMLSNADNTMMQIATTVLMILWLIGVVDSYRQSKNNNRTKQ
ncbi:MAG: hypothetical protein HQL46_00025 [Gammaproteobacteria bacterium]|nr:hypothetical protein [Gammaproteobacteria bacterium]